MFSATTTQFPPAAWPPRSAFTYLSRTPGLPWPCGTINPPPELVRISNGVELLISCSASTRTPTLKSSISSTMRSLMRSRSSIASLEKSYGWNRAEGGQKGRQQFFMNAWRVRNAYPLADSFVFGISPIDKPRVLQRFRSTQSHGGIPVKELADQVYRQGCCRCCTGYVEWNRPLGWRRRKPRMLLETSHSGPTSQSIIYSKKLVYMNQPCQPCQR